jgi:negative regulator of sigma E activity
MNDAIRMQISAFVDGELPDAEADLLLRRMSQDEELRRKAAEYLEIGRAMRGEPGVPGIERLQERISAALDDKPVVDDAVVPEVTPGGTLRPLVGVAVAASVALVALVGLQMTQGVDGTDAAPENAVAGAVEEAGYTVPQPVDEQLRQYYLSHGAASSSELGANGMNARLVTLRLSDEALAAEEEAQDEAVDDETADESPTQP